jgi:hypothetical protein
VARVVATTSAREWWWRQNLNVRHIQDIQRSPFLPPSCGCCLDRVRTLWSARNSCATLCAAARSVRCGCVASSSTCARSLAFLLVPRCRLRKGPQRRLRTLAHAQRRCTRCAAARAGGRCARNKRCAPSAHADGTPPPRRCCHSLSAARRALQHPRDAWRSARGARR